MLILILSLILFLVLLAAVFAWHEAGLSEQENLMIRLTRHTEKVVWSQMPNQEGFVRLPVKGRDRITILEKGEYLMGGEVDPHLFPLVVSLRQIPADKTNGK